MRPGEWSEPFTATFHRGMTILELRLLNAVDDRHFSVDLSIAHMPQFRAHAFSVDMVNEAIRRNMLATVQVAQVMVLRATYTGPEADGRFFDAVLYLEESS